MSEERDAWENVRAEMCDKKSVCEMREECGGRGVLEHVCVGKNVCWKKCWKKVCRKVRCGWFVCVLCLCVCEGRREKEGKEGQEERYNQAALVFLLPPRQHRCA